MKTSITGIKSAPQHAPLVLRGEYTHMINQASQYGYDGIELHIKDPNEPNWKEISSALKKNNICITSFGTGPSYSQERIFLTADSASTREEATKRMKHFIRLGDEFQAVVIVGLIKGQHKDCKSTTEYDKRLYEQLSSCLDYAEKYNVTIATEIIDRFESDWLVTIDEGLDLIKKMNSKALKLHIDTFHMNIEEANCKNAILKAGDKIAHVHVADSDRWYSGHGHYDFKSTFEGLKEINYTGAIALESFLYPDIETCARKNLEFIKQYI